MIWTGEAQTGQPYWWEGLKPISQSAEMPEHCDVLVVGAGYAGLSAALAAHQCGAKVVVVDANEPGFGASTRNGGMFGAHPRLSWEKLSQDYGAQVADDIFGEATTALTYVRGVIDAEGIDCDLQETGRIQLAWTASQFEGQKRLAARIREKSDVQVRVVEGRSLSTEIQTEKYFGGLVFPEHCAIHPAKFHRGLLYSVQNRDIPVVAHAEVKALDRERAGFVAKTPKGDIRASKVVLCTNGYTSSTFRWHMSRVFPLPSYLIATEVLPANLLGHLAPGRRMMVETRARHSYFRLSPDGTRILFGGRASMVHVDLNVAAERLRHTMVEIWPELEDVKLSHIWTGNTGYSFGHMPNVFGHNGLHHAMGFSGSGTVMAPYLGAKAAFQAMGDPRGETAYSHTRLRRHWLHPFQRPYFLQAADAWYRSWVDARETWAGRGSR